MLLFSTQSFEDLIEELFQGFLQRKAHVFNVFQEAAETLVIFSKGIIFLENIFLCFKNRTIIFKNISCEDCCRKYKRFISNKSLCFKKIRRFNFKIYLQQIYLWEEYLMQRKIW